MKIKRIQIRFLRPRPHNPNIFATANFSLWIEKFPRLHVSVFKSNLAVHAYQDSLSVRQLIWEVILGSCEIFIANLLQ